MGIDFVPDNQNSWPGVDFIPDQASSGQVSTANPSAFQNFANELPNYTKYFADPLVGALTGAGNVGQFIGRAPWQIAHAIDSSVPVPEKVDIGQTLNQAAGINPNLGDNIIQGAGQFLAPGGATDQLVPKLADMGEGVLSKMATSGINAIPSGLAFGATQTDNPSKGALISGIASGVLGSGGRGLVSGLNYFAAPSIAGNLTKAIGNELDNSRGITNQDAFDMARDNFSNYADKEKNSWDNVTNSAKFLDETGIPFDNSSYTESLQQRLGQLQNQSTRQSGFARSNSDSENLLAGYLGDNHSSYTDAIEHNKALNQDYKNQLTPGQNLPFGTVNFAKSALSNALNDNINNFGLKNGFGEDYANANAITQQKNQIFNQVVSPSGKTQASKFSQFVKSNNENINPDTFINDYLPKQGEQGIGKFQQFSQMLGDEDTAKSVLKNNIFNNSMSTPTQFFNKFQKLSPDQQSYLFGPDQLNQIGQLQQISKTNPNALNQSSFASGWRNTLPALIGADIGNLMGASTPMGIVGGIVGSNLLRGGAGKLLASKYISNAFNSPNSAYLAKSALLPNAISPIAGYLEGPKQ